LVKAAREPTRRAADAIRNNVFSGFAASFIPQKVSGRIDRRGDLGRRSKK
jgi:hypothetical protein